MSRTAIRMAGDYFALSVGEFLAKVAGFLAFAYLARTLGASSYGTVEFAAALAMIFQLVIDFGFGPVGAREVARDPGLAAGLAVDIPAARFGLALVGLTGMLVAALVLELSPRARVLLVLYGVSLLAAPWNLNWLFQGLNLMHWVAPAQTIRMGLFAAGVVVLVAGPADLLKVGVAELIGATGMAAYYLAAQHLRVSPIGRWPDLAQVRRLFVEALPVGMSRVVWAVNHFAPTVLVTLLVGGSEVAWFGSAHRVVTSLGTFVFLYHFNLFPQIVSALEQGGERLRNLFVTSYRVTAWLGLLAGLMGAVLAGPICRIIFGSEFDPAARVLRILVWLLPISLLGTHPRFGLIAAGRTRAELGSNLAGTLCLALFGPLLIRHLGAVGAAWTMLAGGLVTWATAEALAARYLASLPAPSLLVKPLLATLGALACGWMLLDFGLWIAGAGSLAVFAILGPLLEPLLLRDLKALLEASRKELGDRQ